jgi:2-polyprenyl-3-methyl-5-hydroxy-6-metoxy-1,4-benzoquinol methylase
VSNKEQVYQDYETIADWFDKVRTRDLAFEKPYLKLVAKSILPGGSILDLGCGIGEPVARYFIEYGFHVTGIDGSIAMIEKARRYLPKGRFYVKDMRHINLNEKFNAIILWHSLFHLSPQDQEKLFYILENHIKPNGTLLFTSGAKKGESWSNNGGKNLYHASLSPSEYKELLVKHNFKLIKHTIADKDCGGATVWLAQYSGN